MKIQLISDSSCDYTNDEMKENEVQVIPFYASFDGTKYYQENIQLTKEEFYQTLVEHPEYSPKTSCPTPNDYYEMFMKYVNQDVMVIAMCITSKFSGSYNSAMVAKSMVEEENPNAKIMVIDTMVNTVLQGLLVDETSQMIKENLNVEEIMTRVNTIIKTGRIFFTIGDLTYLSKGGRIGKVASVAAKVANLRPIICLEEGDIKATGIAIGRKKSLQKVINNFVNYFRNNNLKYQDYNYVIGYGYDLDEALVFLDKIKEVLSDAVEFVKIKLSRIGAVIAVHTGPYPLGIAFIKKN